MGDGVSFNFRRPVRKSAATLGKANEDRIVVQFGPFRTSGFIHTFVEERLKGRIYIKGVLKTKQTKYVVQGCQITNFKGPQTVHFWFIDLDRLARLLGSLFI